MANSETHVLLNKYAVNVLVDFDVVIKIKEIISLQKKTIENDIWKYHHNIQYCYFVRYSGIVT